MNKEFRKLFYQREVPMDRVQFDFWICPSSDSFSVYCWNGKIWDFIAVYMNVKNALQLLTANHCMFIDYIYVQHPENQIEMLDLTTTNN